jgi:hypothetical protein
LAESRDAFRDAPLVSFGVIAAAVISPSTDSVGHLHARPKFVGMHTRVAFSLAADARVEQALSH